MAVQDAGKALSRCDDMINTHSVDIMFNTND